MSANDDLPFLQEELRIIERAVAVGKPVLGICLGAQLVAKALGRAGLPQHREGNRLGAGNPGGRRRTPTLCSRALGTRRSCSIGTARRSIWPRGAVWLASSEACPAPSLPERQRLRPAVPSGGDPGNDLGLVRGRRQFGDMRELAAPIDPYANSARLEELARLVFGRWANGLPGAPHRS